MGEKEKEKYRRRRERLLADPEKYREYLEHRRLQRKLRQQPREPKNPDEHNKPNEPKDEPKFRPPLPGESIEQTREKYNRKAEKAIERAEEDRKAKWCGLHRYDAMKKFILEGMPDEEIIERIGIYREKNDRERYNTRRKPDYKLLEICKRIVRGQISKGHYGMSLHALIRGELDGEAGQE